jgi:putative ATP-binding cassette transporter
MLRKRESLKKLCVTIAFVFSFFIMSVTPQSGVKAKTSFRFDGVDDDIQSIMKSNNIAGLSISVVRDQEVIWENGYGYSDVAEKEPALPSTIYRIASITKLFTSLSIMMIQQKGMLDINASVKSYLPEFAVQSRDGWDKKMTIKHLLTHTSGLPANRSNFIFKDLLSVLKEISLNFEPGTGFLYSNVGYDVLGKLIEKVTHIDFTKFVEKAILNPLEMGDSFFWIDTEQKPVAIGYNASSASPKPVPHTGYYGNIPSAGLCSSVEDLGNFLRFIFNGGEFEEKSLLDGGNLEDMMREYSYSRGLGFMIFSSGADGNEPRLIGHIGATLGYTSLLIAAPKEKTGVIILTNTSKVAGPLVDLGIKTIKMLL